MRIVLDAAARLPLASKLVRTAFEAPLWVVVGPDAPRERVAALSEAGATIVSRLIRPGGRLDIHDVLRGLADRGLTTILVEGGARVARSFVEADLVDEAILYRTRTVVGAGGVAALGGIDPETVFTAPTFRVLDDGLVGTDRVTHFWRVD